MAETQVGRVPARVFNIAVWTLVAPGVSACGNGEWTIFPKRVEKAFPMSDNMHREATVFPNEDKGLVMSDGLGAVCDEFYVCTRLFLKLDMTLQRETVLHFLDRIRKEFPELKKLRRRDDGCLMLEEEPDEGGSRRWIRLDQNSLRFGQYAPTDLDDIRRFGELIFTQAPYHLSFSDIDFDHLELSFGFDLEYCGNHDQLVAETLLGDHPAAGLFFGDDAAHIIDAQPYFGIALTPECDLQAYVEIKSRTTTFEVRNDSYEPQPISVLLTLRKYWGVRPPESLDSALNMMFDRAAELATDLVVPNMVNPLAAAIASRP